MKKFLIVTGILGSIGFIVAMYFLISIVLEFRKYNKIMEMENKKNQDLQNAPVHQMPIQQPAPKDNLNNNPWRRVPIDSVPWRQ